MPDHFPSQLWISIKTFSVPCRVNSVPQVRKRAVGSDDVWVKITHCGVCYADVAFPRNKIGDAKYPMVPGHEITGVVKEVGSNVHGFKVGDYVGIGTMVNSCQECEWCDISQEVHCTKGVRTFNSVDVDGTITQGGYSSYYVVHQRFCFKIPDGYPLASAAPLLCAGITVYSPMMRHKMNQSGKSLGVIGVGGLGHMAIKFGKAFGLSVTVFSTSESKRDEALNKLGADKFVVSSNEQQMAAQANSLDFIIDTASGDHPFDPYISLLKTNGILVLVGVPSEVKFSPMNLIRGNKTITGNETGGTKERQEMLNFCAAQKIYPEIEVIPIEYINEALERLIKRDVKYRFVIDIENSLKGDRDTRSRSHGDKVSQAFGLSITVFSTSESKKDEALNKLGADKFVVSSNAQQMAAQANSLDFIIDTASGDHQFDPYISLLKTNGVLALVGVPSEAKFIYVFICTCNKTITGSVTVGDKERQEMLNFCAANKIYPEIEVIPIDYINEAFEPLIKRDVKYRFVIDIENSLKEPVVANLLDEWRPFTLKEYSVFAISYRNKESSTEKIDISRNELFRKGVSWMGSKGFIRSSVSLPIFSPVSVTAVRSDDVWVKITHCGVCYGDVAFPRNEFGDAKYPMVPGHEITGVVNEVGSNVQGFKVGDHVGIGTMANSCQECEWCDISQEVHCTKRVWTFNSVDVDGTITQGGYSSHYVIHQRFCYKIPDGYPLASAAPLLCAGITVYSPMMRHKMNQPGKSLGVIGLGGLGHMAIKFGKAFGLSVTVFSTSESKKDEALNELGADKFVVSSNEQQMAAQANSLDLIIDTASGDHPFDPYISLLKPNGVLVLVGVPSEVKFSPMSLVMGNKTITGNVTGGNKEWQEMLNFCAAHKIYPEIEVIPIEYINEALERLIKRDVKYRFVIDIENSLK
ncbi:hypothetical protein RJ639_035953 [Escallonia herrerae]|uniref:Enoyl reductase (ER) domain-containing protein n=1 Tax=Escallonia herrerae TaxID=1293975 RepID=A0AA89BH94_9ASTE|nr:hypothetical protein RJ639_035953 [Escallonia herrerae]